MLHSHSGKGNIPSPSTAPFSSLQASLFTPQALTLWFSPYSAEALIHWGACLSKIWPGRRCERAAPVFWTAVCKTVRPMLSDRCLSCRGLSVTLVYCGQTAGWIKMPLGMEVCLGPGHIVSLFSLLAALALRLTVSSTHRCNKRLQKQHFNKRVFIFVNVYYFDKRHVKFRFRVRHFNPPPPVGRVGP